MFKTKTKLSTRVMSIFMSLLMAASMLTFLMSVQPTEEVSAANSYGLADKAEEGVILHAWNWSFTAIKNNMKDIAEAGYTSVQTSPVQRPKDYSQGSDQTGWWKVYQPTTICFAPEGHPWFGTKAEFKAMCDEAEKYGIKVIVDVVANHMANNTGEIGNSRADISDQNDPTFRDDDSCWHLNGSTGIDYNNQHRNGDTSSLTHGFGGWPDLNTGSKKVQNAVIDLLKECIDLGADGFRFDAAKHIELPTDPGGASDFWPTVINGANDYAASKGVDIFCYGEILDSPATDITNYTKYIAVTDNRAGNSTRYGVKENNIGKAANSSLTYNGVPANKIVLWSESHDTYANDGYTGESSKFSQDEINRAWAIIAARNFCALYYVRPSDTRAQMGAASGNTSWKNPEVAEVNKFHNAFVGQSEYMSSSGNNVLVERGTEGVVIVNINGSSQQINAKVNKMKDGTYTDHVSGNTFTVSGGQISGQIGNKGIAVVYNSVQRGGVSASPATGTTFTDTLSVTLNANNVTNAKYTTSEGASGSYTDGQKITVGASTAVGGTVKVSLSGTKSDGSTATAEYTYTKKDPTAVTTLYFDNSSYNWSSVYAYIYTGDGASAKSAAAWPGTAMTKDSATGYYKLEVPSGFESGKVIFTESESATTNRYPADMQPGLDIGGSSKIFKAGNTWENYTVTPPVTDPVVTADRASGSSFTTETYDVTLGLSNAVSGTYSVDNGPTKTFTSSTKVTIGEGKIGDSDVTIKATATNSEGKTKNYTFTYKKTYVKKTSSTNTYAANAAARAVAATAAGSLSNNSLAKYYSTNGKGTGKEATITIDGDFSDWSEDMLIAQGAAWDVANHYKGGHENCVLDTYALYAAWDNDNLYVAWQMVNTTDTWARSGDGPLSDGGRVLDVPLILALSIDPNSTSMSNKNTSGGSIWGQKMGVQFDSTTSHVDRLLYMSGKPGLGEPSMFKAVDAQGNTDYEEGCVGFAKGGIEYKMAEGNICSSIMGLNSSDDPSDVCNDGADWVDYKTFSGSQGTHDTKYDSFYEIKIPLSTLGITKDYITSNGIGAMLVATRGESGLDCIPFDVTMLDNATGDYHAGDNTSLEKEDEDVITVPLASIGNGSTPPPPPQSLPLQVNFGADRSAPQEAGTALTLKGIGYGGSNTGYKYEFIVDGTTVQASSSKDSYTWNLTKGNHTIECVITDSKGETATTTKTYTAEGGVDPQLPLKNNSTISATSINQGNSVTMTAKATGGTAPYTYTYLCKSPSSSSYTTLSTTTATSYKHTPTTVGTYSYAVKVVDAAGNTETKNFTVTVNDVTTELENNSTISATSINLGSSIKMTAKAAGGTAPYSYKYFVKAQGSSSWTALTGITTATTYTNKPTTAGTYQYAVRVIDANGKYITKYFTVKVNTVAALANASTISATSINLGTSIKMTAKATGGTAPYKYGYFCKPQGSTSWKALTSTTTATTCTNKPTTAGTYQYAVRVIDATGKYITKYFSVTVNKAAALANASTISATSISLGSSVKMTAKATGGTAPYKYKYFVKPQGNLDWTALTGTTTATTCTNKPAKAGKYQYAVRVIDSTGKYVTKYFDVTVNQVATLANTSTISATSISLGSSIKMTAKATGGTAPYKYKYFYRVRGDLDWTALTSVTTATTCTNKPTATGSYQYAVRVIDSTGKYVTKTFNITVK